MTGTRTSSHHGQKRPDSSDSVRETHDCMLHDAGAFAAGCRSKSAGARRFVASLAQALGAQRRDNGRRHMTNVLPFAADSAGLLCLALRGASSRRPVHTSSALSLISYLYLLH